MEFLSPQKLKKFESPKFEFPLMKKESLRGKTSSKFKFSKNWCSSYVNLNLIF